MARKTLPKTIRRTTDEIQWSPAALDTAEAPARRTESLDLADARVTAPPLAPAGDVVEAAPRPQPATAVAAEPPRPKVDAAERRAQALTIVERHATYSAVGGFVPLPIVNFASVTAIIVRMVKVLSDRYGVPFEQDRARAIVVGLIGGAMPTGLAAVTSSTLFYVVPASGLIGLAVSALAAAACTRSIGRIFVEHFESGAASLDVPAVGKA